jgi:hypothetical protein
VGEFADGVGIEGCLCHMHQRINHILAQLALSNHLEVQGQEGLLVHQIGIG